MRQAAAGDGAGLYNLAADDGDQEETTCTRLVGDGCYRPAGGNELRATPNGDPPIESAVAPIAAMMGRIPI